MDQRRLDRMVGRYLGELDRALARLPRARRRQIREEVEAHIREARGEEGARDEAGLRQLLDRIGDPMDIAREAGADPGRRTWYEALVPLLLPLGGFLLWVGWLVGVAILWASPVWRLRDKVLGTLVVPLGLMGVTMFGLLPGASSECLTYGPVGGRMVTHCKGLPPTVGTLILLVLVVASFTVAIHLDRVRRRA